MEQLRKILKSLYNIYKPGHYSLDNTIFGISWQNDPATKELLLTTFQEFNTSCTKTLSSHPSKTNNMILAKHILGYYIFVRNDDQDGNAFATNRANELPLQQIIVSLIKEGDVYVEVGANYGNIALDVMRKLGDSGLVFAYEPTSNIGDFLLPLSACFNGFGDRFSSSSSAVGNEIGEIIFSEMNQASYGNIISKNNSISLQTHTANLKHTTITTLDASLPVDQINFLRLDVQGSECEVIKGAHNTISNSDDLIISFEWEPHLLNAITENFDPQECIKILQDHGFVHYWEVKGTFKTTALLKDTDVCIKRIAPEEIIAMESGDREFITARSQELYRPIVQEAEDNICTLDIIPMHEDL